MATSDADPRQRQVPPGTPVTVVDENGAPLAEVVDIDTHGLVTCTLTRSGNVKCWGWNYNGELGDQTSGGHAYADDVLLPNGEPLSGAVAIGVSYGGCALMPDTGVKCWSRARRGRGTGLAS